MKAAAWIALPIAILGSFVLGFSQCGGPGWAGTLLLIVLAALIVGTYALQQARVRRPQGMRSMVSTAATGFGILVACWVMSALGWATYLVPTSVGDALNQFRDGLIGHTCGR